MPVQEQEKLKLLFITRKWPPAVGGMEIYSVEMAEEFGKFCNTKVMALPGRPNGQPPKALALIAFGIRCAWYLLRNARRHDLVLIGDLVLAPLALFCRISSRKVRTGVALHGSDVAYHLRSGVTPKLYRCYLFLIRCLRGTLDAMIANSDATARQAARLGLTGSITIPLGVRLPEPVNPARSRNILFVGRIMPRKGAAWFAEQVLPGLAPDIRFQIAGTKWDEAEVERLSRNPRVDLLGPVFGRELQMLRASALLVVVPNIPLGGKDFEGFGLVALEAAADGGIVIAANLHGLSSAILDEETGFLVPAENAPAWRQKIGAILEWTEEQRAAFIADARACLAEEYSWEATARKTIAAMAGR